MPLGLLLDRRPLKHRAAIGGLHGPFESMLLFLLLFDYLHLRDWLLVCLLRSQYDPILEFGLGLEGLA